MDTSKFDYAKKSYQMLCSLCNVRYTAHKHPYYVKRDNILWVACWDCWVYNNTDALKP